jgi:hypothetical protein
MRCHRYLRHETSGTRESAAERSLDRIPARVRSKWKERHHGPSFQALSTGGDPRNIAESWRDAIEQFETVRAKYLLY